MCSKEGPRSRAELASRFRSLQFIVFVSIRCCSVFQLKVLSLAAACRREVFALYAGHHERFFAIVMDDRIAVGYSHALTWFVCSLASRRLLLE